MKTAISIPDDLFALADRFARRSGKSRSRVFQEAVEEYLSKREPNSVTRSMNEALDEIGPVEDPWRTLAERAVLERTEW